MRAVSFYLSVESGGERPLAALPSEIVEEASIAVASSTIPFLRLRNSSRKILNRFTNANVCSAKETGNSEDA
jgi:hypothetical protein